MMETGRVGAYLALFTEIAVVLMVTTLAGVGAGLWVDERLHTLPLFVLIGLLVGLGIGCFAIYRILSRFMARFDE